MDYIIYLVLEILSDIKKILIESITKKNKENDNKIESISSCLSIIKKVIK